MKKKFLFILIISCTICMISMPSCKTGYGCEATEQYKASTNKNGKLSTKKGKSNLFGKKRRKKLKKG